MQGFLLQTSPDAINQAWMWFVEAVRAWGIPIALGLGVLWAAMLWDRRQTGEDPSIRGQTRSNFGTLGIIASGAWASTLIAAAIAWVTWPLPLENQLVGLALVGLVVVHKVMEWNESRDGPTE